MMYVIDPFWSFQFANGRHLECRTRH